MWPCRFHEDKALESLLRRDTPELWSDRTLAAHVDAMRRALKGGGAVLVDPADEGSTIVDLEPAMETTNGKAGNILFHTVMQLIEALAKKHREGGGGGGDHAGAGGYLCTGYDVYLSEEPCLMCSMALVHSRIRRVFFCRAMPDGGLKTLTKLHTIQSLNHLFEVFHLKL